MDVMKSSVEEKVCLLEKELESANQAKLTAAKYGIELVECNKILEQTIDKVTLENELYRRRVESLTKELYTLKHKMLYRLDSDDEDNNKNENNLSTSNLYNTNSSDNLTKCQILLNMEHRYNLMEEDYQNQILEYQAKVKELQRHVNDVQYNFEEKCKLCNELEHTNKSLENDLKHYYDTLLEVEHIKSTTGEVTKENAVLNGKVKILIRQIEDLQNQFDDYIQIQNESHEHKMKIEAEVNSTTETPTMENFTEMKFESSENKDCNFYDQDRLSIDYILNTDSNINDDSGVLVDESTIDTSDVPSKILEHGTKGSERNESIKNLRGQLKTIDHESFVNKIYDLIKDICVYFEINFEGIEVDSTNIYKSKINYDKSYSKNTHTILLAINHVKKRLAQSRKSLKCTNKINMKHSLPYFVEVTPPEREDVTCKHNSIYNKYSKNDKILLKTLTYQVEQLRNEIKTTRNELAECLSEKNRLQQKYNSLLSKKDNINIEVVCKNELYKFEIQLLKNKFSSLYQRHKFETNNLKKELYEVNLQLHEMIHQKLVLQNILEDIQLSKDIHILQLSDLKHMPKNKKSNFVPFEDPIFKNNHNYDSHL